MLYLSAGTSSSTVRADDPLLSAGEQSLYIPYNAIESMRRLGEGTQIIVTIIKLLTNLSYCSGHFGEVFRAVLRESGGRKIDVAIKRIKDYTSEKEQSDFLREMAVMSQLIHPNIIHLHGVVKESELAVNVNYAACTIMNTYVSFITENWIVLEYLPNGDLKQFLMVSN